MLHNKLSSQLPVNDSMDVGEYGQAKVIRAAWPSYYGPTLTIRNGRDMNKMHKLIVATVAAQYLLTGPQIAYSQVLEEVLVTARKLTENLMDSPVAVSVVSGAAMDREGITNLEQLSAKVPSLQLGRSALSQ